MRVAALVGYDERSKSLYHSDFCVLTYLVVERKKRIDLKQSKSWTEILDREILSRPSWFSTKFDNFQMSTFSLYPDRSEHFSGQTPVSGCSIQTRSDRQCAGRSGNRESR
jgi:hypothetical protein